EFRDQGLKNQSEYLASLAADETEKGDAGTGLLLALEALPDAASEDATKRDRPYVSAAEISLYTARRRLRELAVLEGHTDLVYSVAVSPDGAHIVTGSEDGTARVWDAKTFAELAVLKGHTGSVMSVAVSPDGARIVTGSDDRTARVWDAGTFAE